MPTDETSATVVIDAPYDTVLAAIRDVAGQAVWVPEIKTVELLEEYEDGLPATAHFTAAAPVGTDEYTLEFDHRDDGMDWSLVKGKLQTGQDAHYRLRRIDDATTEVTFDLKISHNLPLPGFMRRRVIGDLAGNNVNGLKKHLESGS